MMELPALEPENVGGVMDGHTEEGSYKVTLELTGDQVEQLTRLINMAKMMDGQEFDTKAPSERMDLVAYRAFLEEILQLLYKSLEDYRLGLT